MSEPRNSLMSVTARAISFELELGVVSSGLELSIYEAITRVSGVEEVKKIKGSRGRETVMKVTIGDSYNATFVRGRVEAEAKSVMRFYNQSRR